MSTTLQTTADNKPAKKIDILKSMLSAPSVTDQFKNALKENASVFVASIIDLYNGDAYLQKCEPKEVVMEALKAAVLKLPINKALGFSYIVPYNNSRKNASGGWDKVITPTFQIGYKGYIQLAMRTGQYRIINADKVFAGELKQLNKLTGEIDFSGTRTSDEIVGYFAYIEMVNGFAKTLYRTKDEITKHAQRFSKSYNASSSPWKTDFDAMALKTVISNLLSHYGYLSIEMVGAVDGDVSADNKEQQYQDEVDLNANAQTVDFEEATAEVVDEETGEVVDEETGEVVNENPTPKPAF